MDGDRTTTNILEVNTDTSASTEPAAVGVEQPIGRDVSAVTIGKLMGLVTLSDFNLLQSKIDLMATKVNNLSARFDKILASLSRIPTGSDLERIDVQIAALRSLITDTLTAKSKPGEGSKD